MAETDEIDGIEHQSDLDDDLDQDHDAYQDRVLHQSTAGATGRKKDDSEKKTKPGIVYLSRIPHMMRPQRIKRIFSQYGEIGRVFLQPEEKFKRRSRRKRGGSKTKFFTEGWVEFTDKKIAKSIALTFNNTPIGGKKRSRYYEELWNLKYLHRFQWTHLSERLVYERQVRQQRIRTEISQVKRETNFYMRNVELGDSLQAMEKKKREKGKEFIARIRSHRQRVTQEEHDSKGKGKGKGKSGKVTQNTLSKIFKKPARS